MTVSEVCSFNALPSYVQHRLRNGQGYVTIASDWYNDTYRPSSIETKIMQGASPIEAAKECREVQALSDIPLVDDIPRNPWANLTLQMWAEQLEWESRRSLAEARKKQQKRERDYLRKYLLKTGLMQEARCRGVGLGFLFR